MNEICRGDRTQACLMPTNVLWSIYEYVRR